MNESRTWRIYATDSGQVARNTIEVSAGTNATFWFEVAELLDEEDSVASIVGSPSAGALSVSDSGVVNDKRSIFLDIVCATVGEYEVTATIRTANAEDIALTGRLNVV